MKLAKGSYITRSGLKAEILGVFPDGSAIGQLWLREDFPIRASWEADGKFSSCDIRSKVTDDPQDIVRPE